MSGRTFFPGPVELGYAQITANNAITASVVDVAGLSIPVAVGSRPIKLIFDAHSIQISAAGNFGVVQFVEGATVLAQLQFGIGANNSTYPAHREVRLTPTPGSHTYKIQVALQGGSAGANDRIVANANSPAFIQAVQL